MPLNKHLTQLGGAHPESKKRYNAIPPAPLTPPKDKNASQPPKKPVARGTNPTKRHYNKEIANTRETPPTHKSPRRRLPQPTHTTNPPPAWPHANPQA